MGNQPDNIALDWVRGEIQDTLQQGQQALEAFADNREDSTRLRFCLNHLHQVHGTLRMVELSGAAMLAGEMESLAQALLNESLPLTDERISILMQGILRLPRYLDSLQSSQDDFPLTLLPLLNELRAARSEPLLSDSHLFSPNLEPARFTVASGIGQRLQDPEVLTLLGKLRQMYRFGLKGLTGSEDSRTHLDYLDKVITRLIRLCQKTPSGELWLAAGAFVDSLQGGFNDPGAATTTLLKELEEQLSRLIDEPVDALQQPVPEPLLKNLLYYVARAAEQDSPRVQTLVSRYHLRSALPGASAIASARDKASGPDREAIHSVVTALGEELARLKDQLDLFVRNRERHNRDLEELLPGLHQVANTLSLLSLSIPREVTLEQAERLETLIASETPADDGSLMDIAGALLYVESALYGLEQQGSSPSPDSPLGQQQLNEANTALLKESRNSLEQVKTAIVNFIASQWNTDELRQVPDLLHSIRGGLQLVPLEQAVSMLHSCERFVQEALLEGRFIPDLEQLDILADAITSIEYYLERQSQGIRDNDAVLQLARDSLVSLGFPPGEESTWQPRKNPTQPSDTATPDSTPKAADTQLVDEEILAIFVEEAQEVLDSIDTHYPRFRDHPDDSASLRELRRAFHTLKGSGRLVSATSIGELAWAVENIFNRLLDSSLSVSTRMFELLDRVIERLPSLLQEFRDGHSNGDVSALIRDCHALADKPPARSDEAPSNEQDPAREDTAAEDTPARSTEKAPETGQGPSDADGEADELIDDEILEIFIEEAEEVLETIRDQLPQLLANYDNAGALDQVRRAFHTLKGSGRMVKAGVIAELAWSLEHLLNRVIEKHLFMNPDIGELLQQASDRIPPLVEDFRQQRPASLDTQPLKDRAAALARGEQPDTGQMPEDENPPALERTAPEPGDAGQHQTDAGDASTDPLLLDIFRSEAETHLATLSRFLEQAEDRQRMAYSDDLSRALHTLKGSAHTAGIAPIAAVATPMERYVKAARDQNLSAGPEALALLQRLLDFIHAGLDQLDSEPLAPLPGTDAFLAELEKFSHETLEDAASQEEPHNPLLALFNAEGIEHLLEAEAILSRWADEPDNESDGPARLRQALHHLEEPALKREVHDLAELSHALWQLHQALALSGTAPDPECFTALRRGHEQLIDLLDQLAAGLGTQSDQETLQQLTSLTEAIEHKRSDAREKAFEEQFSGDLDSLDQQMDDDPSLESLSWQQQNDSEEDASILAVFLEETDDLLGHAGGLMAQWQQAQDNADLLRQWQQDLHTLREGARLAGQAHMEDLCAALEAVLSGLNDGYLKQQDPLPELLRQGHEVLTRQLAQIRQGQPTEPATTLVESLEQYRQQAGQPVPVTQVPEEDAQTAAEARQSTASQSDAGEAAAEAPQPEALDPEMVEIFLEEAQELILSTGEALHQWLSHPEDRALAATLQRDLHTLKGGARMAGVKPIGDLGHTLEDLFEKVVDGRLDASNQHNLLFACHDALAAMVDQLSAGETVDNPTALIQQVRALLRGETPAHDEDAESQPEPEDSLEREASHEPEESHEPEHHPEDEEDLSAFFLEEARQIQDNLSHHLNAWDSPQSLQPINQLQRSLQSLRGSARLASLDAVAQLAEGWDAQLNRVLEGHSEPRAIQALSRRCLDTLGDMLDALEAGNAPHLPADLWPDQAQDSPQSPGPENDMDPEVQAIFQEEARELMDALENGLAEWRQDPTGDHNSQAQRLLHTLKGGARLAGLKELGDQAHDFETLLMALPGEGPGEEDWKTINHHHDQIIALVESMLEAPQPQKQEKEKEQKKEQKPKPQPAASPQSVGENKGKKPAGKAPATPPQPDTGKEDAQSRAGKKVAARARRKAEQTRAQQETVRVNAQLLEDLVNLAGETSITRSRMEQQISDFSYTLDEMSATTERLREQLRRMEIETETQILFRAEQDLGNLYDEDFDPLEMDRYSAIQQLSRALTESASDLTDLRETLSEKMRDAETLLLQQSRTNTELQEGLMKTRMTPFSAMVPRLRRIVRQITGELNKQAEFEVHNAEGEMDRTVLERMIAPLEHMLRNALDHGIESAADRRAAGKPETGHVSLSLSREGGEIVLRLQDDGAGISIDRVREKALRQNMMSPDENLSDREILQFILQPGFSTAAAVTQISGRGVGMDVVGSEIKQVGGSLDIDSKVGEGTTFTVRLPFTVSVNRALMVTTGEDYYAIPLNTIEGIVRVSTWELEEFYQPDAPLYEYAGQHYRLQYLGALLNSEHQPKLQGQSLPLPVILVRGADQPMALQVDSLLGSREIVVKSLGPQFNTVRGVSGATILGDGNVVVILDLPAMIRADILSQRQRMLTQMGDQRSRREERPTLVMVVDDSVTVRKVTSRLLERNGMDVMLAKDGLDAVAQLQDHTPDVILLDIEMPRMDGFEVASFVRHDDNLCNVPIVMITSRTGDKHRERAMSIGVNEYLGKPFQEQELLETLLRTVRAEA